MSAKILIVDDEAIVVKSLERLLKKAGYETKGVRSADQAIEEIKKSDFDLIISDIRMPGKNGIEMVREIRFLLAYYNRKRIPEIFMTGYANEETAKEARNMGIAEYLSKPFDVKHFLELVKQHIEE